MRIDFEKLKVFETQNAGNDIQLSTIHNLINVVTSWPGGIMPANVAMAFETLRKLGIVDGNVPQQLNS